MEIGVPVVRVEEGSDAVAVGGDVLGHGTEKRVTHACRKK